MQSLQQAQIAIITDDPGWHGTELLHALGKHGLTGHYLSLTDCQLDFSQTGMPVILPGFEENLPLAVFVRGVPGGSLEQVIFRLDILHMLVSMGIVVYNEPRAIERTVDKAMTTWLLQQAGIPTPPTWVFESDEKARALCEREIHAGHALVSKPLFGSQGIGVQLVNHNTPMNNDEHFSGLYYLQRFIEPAGESWSDIRVFVINGTAIAAMRRHGQSWITNRAQGAVCEQIDPDNRITTLAEAACAAIDIDYAGVDLILDKAGNYQVIEVNSIPAWWGLQKVTEINIADRIIGHFVHRIKAGQSLTVLP